jgi:outer membrane protein insertion porin family
MLGRAPRLSSVVLVIAATSLLAGAAWAAPPPGASPAKHVTPRNLAPAAEDLDDEGVDRLLRIERVEIVGREQVSLRQIQSVLRREGLITGAEIIWPADPRIERARERLRTTGFFKRVTLRLEPIEGSLDRVELVIDLEERSTVEITNLYLGNSRMTPLRGGASVAEKNFLGAGVAVGGSLIWSTLPEIAKARRQQAYKIFAEAPRLGDGKLGVLGSAYIVSASEPYRVAGEEDDPNPGLFRTYDYSRYGGIVGVTFPVLPELELGVDYRFERIDALLPDDPIYQRPGVGPEPVDLAMRPDRHRLTAAHFGITWDGRRQAFVEGKGGRIGLDLSLSSPALGSEYEYVKLVAAGAYTMRLPWGHWLTPIAQGGQIAGRAPVFEQFYSGDLSDWTPGREQSLRFSTRNPIDVFGTGIDTRTFGVIFGRFDLEYVWPLFRRTRTRGVYGGDLVLSAGVFTLVEERGHRVARRERGEVVAPVGFNADFGLRLDTAVGTVSITVGNVLRRTPL